jgi:hypothetical protein
MEALISSGGITLRTKIPFLVAGLAGLALTAAFSLPAAADQPVNNGAGPTSNDVVIPLNNESTYYGVGPGQTVSFQGRCGTVTAKSGEPKLVGRDFFANTGTYSYAAVDCPDGTLQPTWRSIVNAKVHDGFYTVYYVVKKGKYGATVEVDDGSGPPVTTTPPPTQSTPPTKPTVPAKSTQQVPVKPKGAPQTGGGAMADVVSSWG